MSEEVKLDWSSAEVQDGTLTVALEGKLEKGWKNAFARTTALLNGGAWDEVKLKKGKVLVGAISPGDEDRVRQFLEGWFCRPTATSRPPMRRTTTRSPIATTRARMTPTGRPRTRR